MGQSHWKKKQKKAEGKSPDVDCQLGVYLPFTSVKVWCLRIIAGIFGILNKNSRKSLGLLVSICKLRGKKYFIFCESQQEQGTRC